MLSAACRLLPLNVSPRPIPCLTQIWQCILHSVLMPQDIIWSELWCPCWKGSYSIKERELSYFFLKKWRSTRRQYSIENTLILSIQLHGFFYVCTPGQGLEHSQQQEFPLTQHPCPLPTPPQGNCYSDFYKYWFFPWPRYKLWGNYSLMLTKLISQMYRIVMPIY